jgi:hypothetical protein
MIILCSKALAGVSTFERQFLTDYLVATHQKAVVANEVCDTFRYKLVERFGSGDAARIGDWRAFYRPEEIRLQNHHEVPPKLHDEAALIASTRSLAERLKGVSIFITTNPELYNDIPDVQPLTLSEWYVKTMADEATRQLMTETLDNALQLPSRLA